MRHCIYCGSTLGNERFCIKCGADNGNAVPEKRSGVRLRIDGDAAKTTNLSMIFHCGAVILFAVAALLLLVKCCISAQDVIAYSMLYKFGAIFVGIYFFIGMWSVIPALLFFLDIKKQESRSVLGAIIVLVALMLLIAIIKAVAGHFTEGFRLLDTILTPFTQSTIAVIILCMLAAGAGFASIRTEQ